MVREIKPQRAQRITEDHKELLFLAFAPSVSLCVLCGFPKNPISKIPNVSGVLVTATRDNASVNDRVVTKDLTTVR
jgi:hypothetical protein